MTDKQRFCTSFFVCSYLSVQIKEFYSTCICSKACWGTVVAFLDKATVRPYRKSLNHVCYKDVQYCIYLGYYINGCGFLYLSDARQ